MHESQATVTIWVAFLAFIAIGFVAYVIPAAVAILRGHPNAAPIVVVNVLFGWTLIGWGVALAWALTHFETPPPITVIRQPRFPSD